MPRLRPAPVPPRVDALEPRRHLSVARAGSIPEDARQITVVGDLICYTATSVDARTDEESEQLASLDLTTGKTRTLARGDDADVNLHALGGRLIARRPADGDAPAETRSYDPASGKSVTLDLPGGTGFVVGDWYVVVDGGDLWRTDGTAKGTVQLADFNPPRIASNERVFLSEAVPPVRMGDRVVAVGYQGDRTRRDALYVADGTGRGSTRLDAFPDRYVKVNALVPFEGDVVFATDNAVKGDYVFRTDGTVKGTTGVSDIEVEDAAIAATGDLLAWLGDGADSGEEIWVSDGTRDGTRLTADLNPGGESPFDFFAYVKAYAVEGQGVYFSDGTDDTTEVAWTRDRKLRDRSRTKASVSDGVLVAVDADSRRASVVVAGAAGGVVAASGGVAFLGSGGRLWTTRGDPDSTTTLGTEVSHLTSTRRGVAFVVGEDVYLDRPDAKGRAPTRTIHGAVYDDDDRDGTRDVNPSDAVEAALAGQRVYADLDGDGRRDDGEPTDITDGAGEYFLVGVPKRDVTVRLGTLARGFETIGRTSALARTGRGNVARLDFSARVIVGHLTLHFFGDANRNGVQDAGEKSLAGLRYEVTLTSVDYAGDTLFGITNQKGSDALTSIKRQDGVVSIQADYGGYAMPTGAVRVSIVPGERKVANIGLRR